MKDILNKLYTHQCLSEDEAEKVLLNIGENKYNNSQIASFMTVFQMRGITLDELSGFRKALLETCTQLDLSEYGAVDIVGTGGDNKNTFNISTAASFVVAGAGYPVIKHGNYAATSVSGASNVLEFHGAKFQKNKDDLKRTLEKSNFTFLHAPYFHPIMKQVAPIRKELGVRTFFNMMGPLVNPGMPQKQLLGVYNLKMGRLYNYLFQQSNAKYMIVHSLDGYDEISLTGDFKCFSKKGEKIVSPSELGLKISKEEELYGGSSVAEAAHVFDTVLNNTCSADKRNTVLANAAYAINTFKSDADIQSCLEEAERSLIDGRAKRCFEKFIECVS
ncbi:MAG: anthranilate phosphoribosyltransferase [Bacteroidales bacterium]|nr:anthranilate phosphoribosyltransferase [Bacteroidales bacterium]